MYLNWSICLIKVAQHREHKFGVLTMVNYCQGCRVGSCWASHKPPTARNSRLLKWLKWHINYLGKLERQASMSRLALVPTSRLRSQAAPGSGVHPKTVDPIATHHGRTTFPSSSRLQSQHATIISRFNPTSSHLFAAQHRGVRTHTVHEWCTCT